MTPARTPHHLWARNEARCSCYGVAVITRNTSVVGHGFDYPVDDVRRWYARGCKRASWQIPFAPANRISVSATEALQLILVARVSPAKARRCSQSASKTDLFATATESRAPRLFHSAPSPWHRADNRPVDATAAAGWEFSYSSWARLSVALPVPRPADT